MKRRQATHYVDFWKGGDQLASERIYCLNDSRACDVFGALYQLAEWMCPDADRITLQRKGEYGEHMIERDIG